MGRNVEGGIIENQDLVRYAATAGDVVPKDQLDLMARNWFALSPGRTAPIEHSYVDARTGVTETIRITGNADSGIATMHDRDLLTFAISQWVEADRQGKEPSRRIHFTPYQFFSWLNIGAHGSAYARLKDILHRLSTTNIQTTIRNEATKRPRSRIRQFSWISEWEVTEEDGEVRGIEVVLAEWLFESIRDFHVLTLDKRYFEIHGSLERWLYLYARKSTGGAAGIWKESFKNLYGKSASEQQYKHFASALRKLIDKNNLPGLRLEKVHSVKGKDMLLMERTEKRAVPQSKKDGKIQPQEQLALLEMTPLEEAAEMVLEIMRKRLGKDITKSWLEKLHPMSIEKNELTYVAPNKFIAGWVETHYKHKLLDAWTSIEPQVKAIVIKLKSKTTLPASAK